jgi:sphingolipid 8-(E)-desaturase
MGRSKILTRDQIYNLIADGQAIVIFQQRVLRLDSWLEKHPGGKLTIMHMVGRDATDEMNA